MRDAHIAVWIPWGMGSLAVGFLLGKWHEHERVFRYVTRRTRRER